jgi:tripartite-type tricarboxylate transporter receptor subunit TctC
MSLLYRRQFLNFAIGTAALPMVPSLARAQAYPTRPVRIIVVFPAGGVATIVARLMGEWLTERLGQAFIIETRPGAGSNLGTEAALRSSPDGYTLLLVGSNNFINATLYDNLKFNFIRDIEPIANIIQTPGVMEVNPSVPARTVPEFIAYAKANPGKINMASAGNGTNSHMYGELFKTMTGLDMLHVPYRGSPQALTDLIGGQVQVMFDNVPSSIGHIQSGQLRPLAVTTATRLAVLPQLPTVGEFVPGYAAVAYNALGAPKGTPIEIVDKLNMHIKAALDDAGIRARLTQVGGIPMPMTSQEFGKLIIDETEKWAKVIRAANIKQPE